MHSPGRLMFGPSDAQKRSGFLRDIWETDLVFQLTIGGDELLPLTAFEPLAEG
jgi:hypothetical protein